LTPETLARVRAAREAGTPVALLTRLADGAQHLYPLDEVPAELAEAARAALASDKAGPVEGGWFVQPHNPPLRMIVVGAVHVAQALRPLAAMMGFAVTVVDPRRAFATAERFEGVTLNHDWPDEAMEALAPDARTAVVTLTHDPKLDDPALDVALRSPPSTSARSAASAPTPSGWSGWRRMGQRWSASPPRWAWTSAR
jgi:xanthine dehydrogenase accessory factor